MVGFHALSFWLEDQSYRYISAVLSVKLVMNQLESSEPLASSCTTLQPLVLMLITLSASKRFQKPALANVIFVRGRIDLLLPWSSIEKETIIVTEKVPATLSIEL